MKKQLKTENKIHKENEWDYYLVDGGKRSKHVLLYDVKGCTHEESIRHCQILYALHKGLTSVFYALREEHRVVFLRFNGGYTVTSARVQMRLSDRVYIPKHLPVEYFRSDAIKVERNERHLFIINSSTRRSKEHYLLYSLHHLKNREIQEHSEYVYSICRGLHYIEYSKVAGGIILHLTFFSKSRLKEFYQWRRTGGPLSVPQMIKPLGLLPTWILVKRPDKRKVVKSRKTHAIVLRYGIHVDWSDEHILTSIPIPYTCGIKIVKRDPLVVRLEPRTPGVINLSWKVSRRCTLCYEGSWYSPDAYTAEEWRRLNKIRKKN